MSEGPAPADDRHGDAESDTVRVISNLVPGPNTGNPEHAVNYSSDSDSEEWSDDDFEDDEAAQAVFGAGVVGLDEDWSDDAEDWEGDAEAGDVDDDLAAMEEQALAELEADMAELDEAEANMANLEDEELDAVGDEVGPLYAPPAGFDDGIDNDDWDSEDEDENGWDVADTDDEFGSDDEMEDQIGDLHQNLFDLQFAILPTSSSSQPHSFWSSYDIMSLMFPTMFRGLHKPKDLPHETFLSSPADVAPDWHNLNAAGNHFQAADSLSCEGTPSSSQQSGSQDEEILMLQKSNHLALWRFPASLQQPINTASASQNPNGTSPDSAPSDSIRQASSATASTSAAALPDLARSTEPKETDPQLLAYTVLRFKAYSTSRSPNGRLIAAGGHAGFVSVYEVLPNPNFGDPWPSRTYEASKTEHLRKAGKALADPMSEGSHPCPLVLQLISHIAIEQTAGITAARSMANSVRFGTVGGQMRLLVAAQTGHVFVFDTEGISAETGCKSLTCQRLHMTAAAGNDPPSMPILFMTDDQMTQARSLAASQTTETSSWTSCSSKALTATIGHFGHPINCAVSSPDGKYVAVVGDAPRAWIVSAKHGYEWIAGKSRTFAFGAKSPMRSRSDTHLRQDVSPGGQYCCWNYDSTLLAVSSDCYRAVMVFDVQRNQQVLRFEDHPTPCLAVTFAPWDPQLLIFAEDSARVYITDLRHPSKARQRLQMMDPAALAQRAKGHIRGLTVTPGGRLLVAMKEQLLQWDFLRNWSPELHKSYPAHFKTVTKLLMLGASQQAGNRSSHSEGGLGLWCLPKEVLFRILSQAASEVGAWMSGTPAVSRTDGLPAKPLKLQELVQQHLQS